MAVPLTTPSAWEGWGGLLSAARRYGAALGVVGLIVLVRYGLAPYFGDRSALDLFLVAVLVSAWYGGAGPAALALASSLLVGLWLFVPPHDSLLVTDLMDAVETASFLFAGVTISVVTTVMRRATRRAQKSSEEAIRKQADLAAEVERRRGVEAELRAALKELEAYAYTIAHNLRAPLRAVAGMADFIEEDCRPSPEGMDYLDRLREAIVSMDALILGLLEYSRVSRVEFRRESVPLGEVVEKAARSQSRELTAKRARLTIDHPLPSLLGDRQALVEVLSQLLSNACKFVPPDRDPAIRVWAEEKGPRVRLWVEDNGIGLDPKYHDRIFGVFERLHGPEDFQGTGIGLAIVRRCIQRMGGETGVESEPGKGSRFWIEGVGAEP